MIEYLRGPGGYVVVVFFLAVTLVFIYLAGRVGK